MRTVLLSMYLTPSLSTLSRPNGAMLLVYAYLDCWLESKPERIYEWILDAGRATQQSEKWYDGETSVATTIDNDSRQKMKISPSCSLRRGQPEPKPSTFISIK